MFVNGRGYVSNVLIENDEACLCFLLMGVHCGFPGVLDVCVSFVYCILI